MIIVSEKGMLTRILLQNGRNKGMRTCAAYVAYRPEIQILEPTAFVESPRASLKWGESLSAHIVAAEDALDKDLFFYFLFFFHL